MSADIPSRGVPDHRPEVSALRRAARRMAWLYTAAAVFLFPWIVYLAITLPKRDLDRHYKLAWVGFDLLLAFAVICTAYFAFRIDPRVELPATATATLLIVDAWFDVTTSGNRNQLLEAVLMALCFEIPAAVFSIYLARRVNRQVADLADIEHLIRNSSSSPPADAPGSAPGPPAA